MFLFQHIFKS